MQEGLSSSASLRSWWDERAGKRRPYSIAGEACEEFASSEALKELVNGEITLHQSSHGFATSIHGFATKTKALTREIPPATQATPVQVDIMLLASQSKLTLFSLFCALGET